VYARGEGERGRREGKERERGRERYRMNV